MRIGTLTFHRANNYGGVLQCYALVCFLKKKGYEAEVVDYRSKAIDEAYRLINMDNLHKFISSIIRLRYRYKSNLNFKLFRERYISISKKQYIKSEDLSNDYDVLFVGSDQVWSKRINKGFDPIFWGQIPNMENICSYAASMGTDHHFNDNENRKISSFLNSFKAISVREDSLADELSSLTSKQIVTVIDPTLLLSINDYMEIAQFPCDSNYLLYYQMEYHPDSKYRVQEVAKELGCKIIVIGGKKEKYEVPMQYFNASTVSPTEFIGYFLRAKCVFSSSFHGTALSIAMRKDFYFFANYETDRAANLLKHIGALDRMILSTTPLSFSQVNYSRVLPKLEQFKMKSEEFLITNIETARK